MGLVSQSIDSLFGGVSQQSPAARHPNQCEEMDNVYASVVRGLSKRPPTQHVTKATSSPISANTHIHFIDRNASEKYVAFFKPGQSIQVFSLLDGSEKTVYNNAASYLHNTDPKSHMSMISVADYTFVTNKDTVVTSGGSAAGVLGSAWQSLVEINDPNYGINPASGYHEITGDGINSFDSFYVMGDGEVWREVPKPGIKTTLTASTMPHSLVRNGDGTFTFGTLTWSLRKSGDDNSSPEPSFVGGKVNDVFFHRNRLGMLSGENVILSEAGEFFNYWRTTATQLLDSDPIDVAVSHNKVSTLAHAVPFNKSLYLFAGLSQFVMDSNGLLTPRTAGVDQTTEYEVDTTVRPVGSGSTIFFATPGGSFSHLYEYYVDEESSLNVAANVTAHAPKYLPANPSKIASSVNYDTVFVLSDDAPNKLYVYRYYWKGNEKVQSAWGTWTLGDDCTLLSMEAIGNYLYLVVNRASGTYIEKIDLELFAQTDGMDFLVHLDRLKQVTGTYDGVNDWTTFSLPYEVDASITPKFVYGPAFGTSKGVQIPPASVTRVNNYTFRVPGDVTAGYCYVGESYTMSYTFSPVFVRNQQGAIIDGDLRLRTMTLYYEDTAYFKTRVTPLGRSASEQIIVTGDLSTWNSYGFTGKTVGTAALTLGQLSLVNGKFRFPVFSAAISAKIEILNDSHYASNITKVDWEGNLTMRNKRI